MFTDFRVPFWTRLSLAFAVLRGATNAVVKVGAFDYSVTVRKQPWRK